jgi:sporulation protein YlmC with PRC-barrel domain
MKHLLTVAALAGSLAAFPALAQNPQGPSATPLAPTPPATQSTQPPTSATPPGCELPGATISASGQPCADSSSANAASPSTPKAGPDGASPSTSAQSKQPTTPPAGDAPSSSAANPPTLPLRPDIAPPPATAESTPLPDAKGVAAGETFIDQQAKDQHLASKMIGTSVQNPAGEKIGDVKDILVSEDGRIVAVLLGVGGFLGIGEKSVALSFDMLHPGTDKNGDMILTADLNKDALNGAPDFKTLPEQQALLLNAPKPVR